MHTATDTQDESLEHFFSRPMKIASLVWNVGSVFGITYNPWNLYFTNKRVINRISNYNILRCKLCLRIVVNGNSFLYGKAMASYRPLHGEDDFQAWRMNIVPHDIIGASQRMHVWLDPTKNQGGTLELPFIWYKNGLNIPLNEWDQMGELDISGVTDLAHANGGTGAVSISIFAWAEDVALSMPTITEPGALVPQGDEYEEASDGPVSGPAHAVAALASKATAIPQIGRFALATQMAAGAIGSIAKLFGMSRPVDAGPVNTYKPAYMGNMANANVIDTSNKLTYDVKQELTVDPGAVGLGSADEMAISSIIQRESFLTEFNWATTDSAEGDLWFCRVTPALYGIWGSGDNAEYHHTPMSYVSQAFMSWRGSIKFRFQIAASSFHKGRIKIVYDPYYTGSVSEYNTQYSYVLDVSKERDFTVTIGWGQEASFLNLSSTLVESYGTTQFGGPSHELTNGVLAVYVVNELTTAADGIQRVPVLVSVAGGSDMEFANPRDTTMERYRYYVPQSDIFEDADWTPQAGDISSPEEDLTRNDTRPVSDDNDKNMMGNPVDVGDVYKVYYGDPVYSVRQLLKRYVGSRAHVPNLSNADTGKKGFLTVEASNFPQYPGYDPQGDSTAGVAAYTYSRGTHLNYFTPLFLCRRGGLRWKYLYADTGGDYDMNSIMAINRIAANGSSKLAYQYDITFSNLWNQSQLQKNANLDSPFASHSGGHATSTNQNPVVEAEMPYASIYRFSPARKKDMRELNSEFTQQHRVSFPASTGDGRSSVLGHTAAGDDFSLAFFQACPVLFVYDDPSP